jgi:hypothetical protein
MAQTSFGAMSEVPSVRFDNNANCPETPSNYLQQLAVVVTRFRYVAGAVPERTGAPGGRRIALTRSQMN